MGNRDELFANFDHRCGKGHSPVSTEEGEKQPDNSLIRRYQCPECDQVFDSPLDSAPYLEIRLW